MRIVEKLISPSYIDSKKLLSLAKEKAKISMVGHVLEYHPAIIKLKELVENYDLRNIKYIYSDRLNLGKFITKENILWNSALYDISAVLDL